ncbi:MAG TPA: Na+/H+ antiporter NhaC family protein [Bacillales bacterium]|nr:Na+/H+ antiporter NhaC family protein [Bacillales bacterium]
MEGTWVCLLPFLIVIPISMLTKQVQPGLFVALLLGCYLIEPSLLGGIHKFFTYLLNNIVVTSNIEIVIFLYAFAGLIGMIKYTGGVKGFVHLVSQKVKTKRSAMFLTWFSTIGTFSDPDFRIVTVAPVMKALRKRLHMTKKQIAFAIAFTANPVVALIPVATAYVGFMVSVIGQSLDAAGVNGEPYVVYVKSIPFNFFSFVLILVGIYYSFFKKMKDSEEEGVAKAQGANSGGQDGGSSAENEQQSGGSQMKPNMRPGFSTEMGSDMDIDAAQAEMDLKQAETDLEQAQMNDGVDGDLTRLQTDLTQAQIDLKQAEMDLRQAQNLDPNAAGTGSVDAGGGNSGQQMSTQEPGDESSGSMSEDSGKKKDFHEESTGMYETDAQKQEDRDLAKKDAGDNPHADQQEDLNESHRAYMKETPIRPWNLIIPIILFILLTLFLSWWNGHAKANGFFQAFIKSDMLMVMLESLLIAIIVSIAYFMFQRFSVSKLATHFIKGGNELMTVIVMLALIWGVTAVSEDLGFSKYITAHVSGWIPTMFVAPVLFVLGAAISYFIGSSWGTWGLLMPLGVTLATQSGANLLLVIGAVFASGTFGAFASPLSDNTVTLSTIMDMEVVKYSRQKLVPASIAGGITVILFGVFSFLMA